MKKKKQFSKSVRKFIRDQKAQIRRQIFDDKKQEEAIKAIYDKLASAKKLEVTAK